MCTCLCRPHSDAELQQALTRTKLEAWDFLTWFRGTHPTMHVWEDEQKRKNEAKGRDEEGRIKGKGIVENVRVDQVMLGRRRQLCLHAHPLSCINMHLKPEPSY